MRVAMNARYLCDPFGSMTVFCTNLLSALVELDLGARPAALIPRALHESAYELREHLGDRVDWVRSDRDLHDLGMVPGQLRWVHREIPALIARHVPDTDVYIEPYHTAPVRLPGVQRVAFLHDLCGLGVGFPKYKKAYWRHYLKLREAAHLTDAIWPVSEATRDAMAARFRASRSRLGPVLYNGVDRQPVSDRQRAAVLEQHGLEARSYVVAFATWQERKNFRATLDALSLLRKQGTDIRLVGITPSREVASVVERVRTEGHEDALILSGVSNDELDALYAGSLALVWPSTCEGYGYPVVEAMVQGCPPLVSSEGPGAELIRGAFPPLTSLTSSNIATRITELQSLPAEERSALADSLKGRAAHFSVDRYREQLRDALRDITYRRDRTSRCDCADSG